MVSNMQKPELLEQIISHTAPNLTSQEREYLVNSILIIMQPKCLFKKDSNIGKKTNEWKPHGVNWEPYKNPTIPTVKCNNCQIIYYA